VTDKVVAVLDEFVKRRTAVLLDMCSTGYPSRKFQKIKLQKCPTAYIV